MDTIHNELHNILDEPRLQEILNLSFSFMDQSYRELSAQVSSMPNVYVYQELLDYCYEELIQYIRPYDHVMNILCQPTNIQPVYFSIVEAESFKSLCTEELKAFPRILAMTLLVGIEMTVVKSARQVLDDQDEKILRYLDELIDTYQDFLIDALSYGKGEKKSYYFAEN